MPETLYNDKIESLFNFADSYYSSRIYPNERARYIIWLIDPSASQTKKNKILANFAWADEVWAEYLDRKQNILNGMEVDPDFSSFGDPPHTFLEILQTP